MKSMGQLVLRDEVVEFKHQPSLVPQELQDFLEKEDEEEKEYNTFEFVTHVSKECRSFVESVRTVTQTLKKDVKKLEI